MCTLCEHTIYHIFCDGGVWRKGADPLCDRCLQGVPHKRHDKKAHSHKKAYSNEVSDCDKLVVYEVPRREPRQRRR